MIISIESMSDLIWLINIRNDVLLLKDINLLCKYNELIKLFEKKYNLSIINDFIVFNRSEKRNV